MSTSLQKDRHHLVVYSRVIFNDMVEQPQSVTFKRQSHIGASHMLTKISYHVLGTADKLPKPLSQGGEEVDREEE